MPKLTVAERFWSHVEIVGNCWEWTACRVAAGGYGKATAENRRSVIAHRLSWMLTYGPIPPGMLVLHACDNPPCVRPSHLSLGTHADNMRDMAARGRQRGHPPKRLGPPKPRRTYNRPIWLVTEEMRERMVAEYRAGRIQTDIAKDIGLTQASVSRAIRRAGLGWRQGACVAEYRRNA